MRLLFDHNLSPDLKSLISDLYPQSLHVWDLEMDTAADTVIWAYAVEGDFVIVTKDSDYRDLSIARGASAQGDLDTAGQLPHIRRGRAAPRAPCRVDGFLSGCGGGIAGAVLTSGTRCYHRLRSARPGRAPVCPPLSITSVPLTAT